MVKYIFPLVVFGNLWTWKIFGFNFGLGVLLILSTWFLFLLAEKGGRALIVPAFLLIGLLLVSQLRLTEKISFTDLTDNEKQVQTMRLREYPPVYIKIGPKTLWLPMAHWFEERRETIVFFGMLKNISEVVDPNLYFFAKHPRERVGGEFEKFPYLLLPAFVFGVLVLAEKKRFTFFIAGFLIPLIIFAVARSNRNLGPFLLFPFVSVAIISGLDFGLKKIKNSLHKNKIIIGFLILYLLVFIQIYSYAIN